MPAQQHAFEAQQSAASFWENPAAVNVTAIGSCRIMGPLRHALADDCFKLNQSGVYGYCHSSAEAVQQLKVLQGDFGLPKHLLPLTSPKHAENLNARRAHVPSDLYVVELSSAKILTIDGVCIQLNYFTRHFASFFADRERSRAYWRAVREDDDAERRTVLDTGPQLHQRDRYLLDQLTMRLSSCDDLARDIAEIQERVPNVLFVTHFDAKKRDGAFLVARQAYLQSVRAALRKMGAIFFDPSDYVEAFGQSEALYDPNGSLTHYSEPFEQFLGQNWRSRYIEPLCEKQSKEVARSQQFQNIRSGVAACG